MRLNREYRAEAAILERVRQDSAQVPNFAHHKVFVFVNSVDLAVLEALRYGRGLRPSELKAVHFAVDAAQAEHLRTRWEQLGLTTSLKIVDCPDRRLAHAAGQLVLDELGPPARDGEQSDVGVTVLLPRRSYAPLLGRLLHDRSADRIARMISRIPQAAATIVPYDVQSRIREAFPDLPEQRPTRLIERLRDRLAGAEPPNVAEHNAPPPDVHATPIGELKDGLLAMAEGRVHELDHVDNAGAAHLEATLTDASGTLTVRFSRPARQRDRTSLEAGQLVRLYGRVSRSGPDQSLTMIDPHYDILSTADVDDSSEDA
jgi:hypothetical protein